MVNDVVDSLARLLCEHAQAYNYDHKANPTIDMNVGACPRHIAIANELVTGEEKNCHVHEDCVLCVY